MIQKALEYLVNLGKNEIVEVNGQRYSTKNIKHMERPQPNHLGITTLTGLVDYIKSDIDKHASTLLLHVCGHRDVRVYSPLKDDSNRDNFISCVAQVPNIHFDTFTGTEQFNIMLQSCFIRNEGAEAILKVVGNIKEQNIKQVGDDGISQEVTVKTGVARVENIIVPNPVTLRPYRTFSEVEQPESNFVFRMKDGPSAALFEADGGAWKNKAMQNIKKFLEFELKDCDVKIIA